MLRGRSNWYVAKDRVVARARAGCGADAIEEFTGVNREIPEPKSAWATTTPPLAAVDGGEPVAPVTTASAPATSIAADLSVEGALVQSNDGICAVFLAVMLTSPDTFGSDEAANAAYRPALEPISAEAAALLDAVSTGASTAGRLWQDLARLDALAADACGVPFANAQIVLATYNVEGAGGWPTAMPCFVPTGETLCATALSHAAVDCLSGQAVTWRDGEWRLGR